MNMEVLKSIYKPSKDKNVGLQEQPIIGKEEKFIKEEVKKDGHAKGDKCS